MAHNDFERNSMEPSVHKIYLFFFSTFFHSILGLTHKKESYLWTLLTICSNILYKFTVQMAILSIYKSGLLRDLLWIKDFK